MIDYKETKTDLEILNDFYIKNDECFNPKLSTIVDISSYVNKIHKYANLFTAWDNDALVGIVACYINDINLKNAFITSVIVSPNYQNKKIASNLLRNCIEKIRKKHYERVSLEVYEYNNKARNLYQRFGFIEKNRDENKIEMEMFLK